MFGKLDLETKTILLQFLTKEAVEQSPKLSNNSNFMLLQRHAILIYIGKEEKF